MKKSYLLKIQYNSIPDFLPIITMNMDRNQESIIFIHHRLENYKINIVIFYSYINFAIGIHRPHLKTLKANLLKRLCLTESFRKKVTWNSGLRKQKVTVGRIKLTANSPLVNSCNSLVQLNNLNFKTFPELPQFDQSPLPIS